MISTAIRLARVGSRSELIAAAFMGLSYPCVMIAALIPNIWFFAAATLVTYVSDWFLHQRRSYLINRLAKVRAGLSIRFLLRELLLILLLARLQLAEQRVYYAAVACFLLFYGLQAAHGTLTTLIRLRRVMPVVTRNVDLGAIPIPGPPPRRLLNRAAEKMLHLDVFAMVGLVIAAKTGTDDYGYFGIFITLGLAVLYIAALVPYILKGRRVPSAATVLAGLDDWLREYRPTVALYFSGSRDSAYQVNMWLETMAQTEGRPLIILRERAIVSQLASTTVPVVCVPGGVHLMNMDLSTVRVALYAANVGKNIHMLRVPTIKHVFIGHGDSDKLASVNPYSKAYDEVWTAGRAGRDRYALADVGVRDEDIVEVGRPQLAPIESWTGTPKQQIPTVLYAPTWEGWDDNPGNTSLLLAGENIVKRLLGAKQPVRVLYKPHPFTGTRSAKAKAAHLRITAMVEKAAADRAAEPRWTEQAAAGAADRAAAQAELTRIEARLDELAQGGPADADESEESRASLADPAREDETTTLRSQWNRTYWRTFGYWEHRVITGGQPHLYDCFNESDGMVSDISSVVSDFIASGKPYAVTDSAELGAEEFKRQNTAVRAAVILSNSAKEIDRLLTAITESSADPLADDRRELKEYLLGPDEPTSMEQFNAAVRALTAKADARNAAVAQRTGAAEPEGAPGLNDSDATPVDSAVGD
ncbi:hypothetical protein ACIPW9_01445 [Streptomyces sp. NPDC090052]|uniref:hypothetical protein n=1 Tax=unclassified Streptomyces TaxID=2593676 RepID=UPI002253DDAC|nr:hypothetical protein [Streptomyces sp. NBC_01306]MCX4726599.1 hypothetical protein [Streptomyces sp. NBC_01306]